MRATCEFSERKEMSELPNVTVRIYKTRNNITIKISDLGGGINRASSSKIFNYMYSTAPQVLPIRLISQKHLKIPGCSAGWRGFIWSWFVCWNTSDARTRLRSSTLPAVRKILQGGHTDSQRGRVRDRCVRVPAEAVPHGSGEPARVQCCVQCQAQKYLHTGPGLDRSGENILITDYVDWEQ